MPVAAEILPLIGLLDDLEELRIALDALNEGIVGRLAETPADVNTEPMGKGWFFRIKLANKGDLDGLMDAAAYAAFVKNLG